MLLPKDSLPHQALERQLSMLSSDDHELLVIGRPVDHVVLNLLFWRVVPFKPPLKAACILVTDKGCQVLLSRS